MNNCAIVIFGATGDLTKRKLIPALYRLIVAKKLVDFVVLGAAIGDVTSGDIVDGAREFVSHCDEEAWRHLKERFYYQRLNFTVLDDYSKVYVHLQELEQRYQLSGNRIIYLACAASFFCDITDNVARVGLAQRMLAGARPWQRIVYEKPFGHDLSSAQHINKSIARVFDEHQIYRIDHYLTKELVSNITLMRFTNCFFEPLWNATYIDHVQIILSEKIGIDGRGGAHDEWSVRGVSLYKFTLKRVALLVRPFCYFSCTCNNVCIR